MRNPIHRFWEKVQIPFYGDFEEDCWIWVGTKTKIGNGYGILWLKDKMVLAHRFSWEIANGSIPLGKYVLHKCDNRSCANPYHLFLGTQVDNINDMVQKNRQSKGLNRRLETGGPKTSPNASKFKGVCWDKGTKKWRARILIDGKSKHLGLFMLEEEASEAYQEILKGITNGK